MSDKYNVKITNTSHISLSIPEVGIHLPGRGSHMTVESDLVKSCSTLTHFLANKWVQIEYLKKAQPMPHWPFYSIPSPSVSINVVHPPTAKDEESVLSEIRDLLKEMVGKQASPEVLATHIALQSSKFNSSVPTPAAVHVSGKLDDAPEFIPSKIVPNDADISIKSETKSSEKSNFDNTAAALKKMRKG